MSSFVVILMSLSGAPGDFGGVPRIDAVPASRPLFLLGRPALPRNARLNFHRPFPRPYRQRHIRGAPRDALIGEIAPSHLRGACYGLRQSLDTVGAFAGPLLAVAFMVLLANDIQAVFWIAAIPAFISVAILILAVKEPQTTRPPGFPRAKPRAKRVRRSSSRTCTKSGRRTGGW